MKKSWLIIMLFAFIIGLCANYYFNGPSRHQPPTQILDFKGSDNKAVNIFDPQDPRIRIVYFGFTRCSDVCPTSLAMLSAALKQLNAAEMKRIRPMFITLDPERDSGDDAQKYAHYFHSKMEGFSGSLEATKILANRYGVIFQKTELQDSALNYTIDHSSYFYFLKPDGTLLKKVPHTLNPQPLILAIQNLEKDNMT